MKVSLSPDILLRGWLGLKHRLTNERTNPGVPTFVSPSSQVFPSPPRQTPNFVAERKGSVELNSSGQRIPPGVDPHLASISTNVSPDRGTSPEPGLIIAATMHAAHCYTDTENAGTTLTRRYSVPTALSRSCPPPPPRTHPPPDTYRRPGSK